MIKGLFKATECAREVEKVQEQKDKEDDDEEKKTDHCNDNKRRITQLKNQIRKRQRGTKTDIMLLKVMWRMQTLL